VDLRVSTLPASHGEKIVIRVLDARTAVRTLDAIGFATDELERIERVLQAREGLVLVTGPTGSGKTTTLYAALRKLKQRGVNIVTVEDPIEYRLPGIVQVQVRERAGLTFAAALRSIMRQDPDVLLIGEIRDRETAEIAIQASLTGHLVLSTLHTNDAASAVTRLLDIGVAPYKIATAVKGVLAQRLLRRLCSKCRRAIEGEAPSGVGAFNAFAAVGCRACGETGYHGRLAIVEVIITTPELERRIAAGEPTERIAEAARHYGMLSLWQSGLARVRAGDTTEEELVRVASPDVATAMPGSAAGRRTMEVQRRIDYLPQSPVLSARLAEPAVPQLSIGTVDVYVIRPLASGWRVLVLQRAVDTRCPTAWETVHGHIESGEEPEDAAVREVREESGLEASRLYNVTVQPFYLHKSHTVQLAVVFAAFVAEPADLTLGAEHQRAEWLPVDEAFDRFQWPREREALREIVHLLRSGDAGPVEDVLRVR
jgi:Tfp pilus assembly pilus retraction ATPase PilT/8-oxo-dGTP pyrophosphatase MutT (NUDIX family)